MKIEFVNPFLAAAYHVLEQEIKAEIKKGDIAIQESPLKSEEVTVLVGVTGEVQGVVMYCMSERTAKNFASAMMGEVMPVFDKLVESAIAEMGNVITGSASGMLEQSGYSCTIAPPSVISGRGLMISTLAIKRLVIPVLTPLGDLTIHVALQDKKDATPMALNTGAGLAQQ